MLVAERIEILNLIAEGEQLPAEYKTSLHMLKHYKGGNAPDEHKTKHLAAKIVAKHAAIHGLENLHAWASKQAKKHLDAAKELRPRTPDAETNKEFEAGVKEKLKAKQDAQSKEGAAKAKEFAAKAQERAAQKKAEKKERMAKALAALNANK